MLFYKLTVKIGFSNAFMYLRRPYRTKQRKCRVWNIIHVLFWAFILVCIWRGFILRCDQQFRCVSESVESWLFEDFCSVRGRVNDTNWRVWSWLRTNAGGVAKTCKSNELSIWVIERVVSGERVRNKWVTYPGLRDSVWMLRHSSERVGNTG